MYCMPCISPLNRKPPVPYTTLHQPDRLGALHCNEPDQAELYLLGVRVEGERALVQLQVEVPVAEPPRLALVDRGVTPLLPGEGPQLDLCKKEHHVEMLLAR